ncbi:hypothetical protein, partial [Desulfocastanea catecholica]
NYLMYPSSADKTTAPRPEPEGEAEGEIFLTVSSPTLNIIPKSLILLTCKSILLSFILSRKGQIHY